MFSELKVTLQDLLAIISSLFEMLESSHAQILLRRAIHFFHRRCTVEIKSYYFQEEPAQGNERVQTT
ncbi:hypothetical protein LENED_010876 [Lentinula edodes]|uniref:Uncharacterized protein n=1 Tax=Lentinula edodes TaxID=5353 RepID=A0A1Q3ENM9_LENED|nr:hypothetical protein LENED_010876 [Lentinula edodes]